MNLNHQCKKLHKDYVSKAPNNLEQMWVCGIITYEEASLFAEYMEVLQGLDSDKYDMGIKLKMQYYAIIMEEEFQKNNAPALL